jgi:hypothetical protein
VLENITHLEIKMIYTNEVDKGKHEIVAAVINTDTGELTGLRVLNFDEGDLSFTRYISFDQISFLSTLLTDLLSSVSGGDKNLVGSCLSIVNDMRDCRPEVGSMTYNQSN